MRDFTDLPRAKLHELLMSKTYERKKVGRELRTLVRMMETLSHQKRELDLDLRAINLALAEEPNEEAT